MPLKCTNYVGALAKEGVVRTAICGAGGILFATGGVFKCKSSRSNRLLSLRTLSGCV
jgi:hypothetical protein